MDESVSYKLTYRDFRNLISKLYAVSSRLQSIRRELSRGASLGATDWSVMLTLNSYGTNGDGLRIREIADHLHIAAANVTAAVNILEAKGLVVKQEDSRDARAVGVSLTEAGRAEMLRLLGRLRDVNDVWFSGLSKEELVFGTRLLDRLIHQFDTALAISKSVRN